MNFVIAFKKFPLLLIIVGVLTLSCESETVEVIDKTLEVLPNGKRLEVEKTNKDKTSIGVITKHDYGTSHSYYYKFSLEPDEIVWDGGSSEPKQLLFANDSIYLRFLKEKSIRTESKDSITGTTNFDYHYEVQEIFQKHVDKRYFFKLFGKAYWLPSTQNAYHKAKESGQEYTVPNDNELTLPTAE